jgi:hypothetical protein
MSDGACLVCLFYDLYDYARIVWLTTFSWSMHAMGEGDEYIQISVEEYPSIPTTTEYHTRPH